MSVLKDARQKAGCDTEELWFHKRDRELIEKMNRRERFKLIHGGRSHQSEQSDPTNQVFGSDNTNAALKKAA